jgi:predicted acyltransferase
MSSPDRTRILSIDLLRGLDVWLMLFVNEMAGVSGTPFFLRHYPHDGDGMTITDLVFPAFLFIVGLAIPFAIGARRRRGESAVRLWRHLLVRTLGLLVLGVLMVNAEQASPNGLVSRPLWTILSTLAVILIWQSPEAGEVSKRRRVLRLVGFVLLLVLVLIFRREGMSGIVQIRPMWWGILGLIGWAYLVAGTIYILAGDRPAVLVSAMALLYCVFMADEAGHVALFAPIDSIVDVGTMLAAHSAITLGGVVLGVWLVRHRESKEPARRLIAASLGYAAALGAAGLLLHSLNHVHAAFRINKIGATAPWCLLSCAWTTAAWTALFALVDVRGFRRWPRAVTMAGENALLAYLLPPVMLALFELAALAFGRDFYGELGQELVRGTIRSILFAWMIVRLCGLMRARGIRMQL